MSSVIMFSKIRKDLFSCDRNYRNLNNISDERWLNFAGIYQVKSSLICDFLVNEVYTGYLFANDAHLMKFLSFLFLLNNPGKKRED